MAGGGREAVPAISELVAVRDGEGSEGPGVPGAGYTF